MVEIFILKCYAYQRTLHSHWAIALGIATSLSNSYYWFQWCYSRSTMANTKGKNRNRKRNHSLEWTLTALMLVFYDHFTFTSSSYKMQTGMDGDVCMRPRCMTVSVTRDAKKLISRHTYQRYHHPIRHHPSYHNHSSAAANNNMVCMVTSVARFCGYRVCFRGGICMNGCMKIQKHEWSSDCFT